MPRLRTVSRQEFAGLLDQLVGVRHHTESTLTGITGSDMEGRPFVHPKQLAVEAKDQDLVICKYGFEGAAVCLIAEGHFVPLFGTLEADPEVAAQKAEAKENNENGTA